MTGMVAKGATWLLPRGAGGCALARDLVRNTLHAWGWSRDRVDAALLLVSELVGNAYRHARAELWLGLYRMPGGVRFTVRDGDPAPPVRRTPDMAGGGGFGLRLLDGLADRWGWYPDTDGKCVWAELSEA